MKKKVFRIYLILTLLWVGLIFLQSCLPAGTSNTESGGLLSLVQLIFPWMTNNLLRKIAHFAEFSVLGILMTGTFWYAKKFYFTKPLFFCLLTALCDETFQLFTAGRGASVSDVWLDFSGAFAGAILLWLILRLRKR